jgi:hypothetical protein
VKRISIYILAVTMAILASRADAIPITYQIKFTVLTGVVTTLHLEAPDHFFSTSSNAAGNIYSGLFSVDSDILLTDGIGKVGDLDFFLIQMEDNIWGYNLPVDNSFRGFRGPRPDSDCNGTFFCFGAPSPGFDVVNGEIVNLRGGVFGETDAPLVDFSSPAPNVFLARGAVPIPPVGGTRSFVGEGNSIITGTMEIFRVSEPGVVALFGLTLGVLVPFVRRRPRVIAEA